MKWIFGNERPRRKRLSQGEERLQRVVNLIPEYVDALIEERAGAEAMGDGMDGRRVHGPALRKSEKVEARIAQILGGGSSADERRFSRMGRGLLGSEQRRVFFGGGSAVAEENKKRRLG